MDKATWRKRIVESSEAAGTYRPCFDDMIDTLAGILERRDEAEEQYLELGGEAVVEYTNKAGATNIVKNPALTIVDQLNNTALTYWKELGLTPAGLKRINETAMKGKPKQASLGAVLKDLGI